MFEAVLVASYEPWFKGKSNEQKAKWVAEQLRCCGFNTEPCGASWGVLVDNQDPPGTGPGGWPYSGN